MGLLWRVEGPLRAGALNRPPPALAAAVGGAGPNSELPQGRFFWGGGLPHPHFIEEILETQRRMQQARATPDPCRDLPHPGSAETHSFLSGWVLGARGREAEASWSLRVPSTQYGLWEQGPSGENGWVSSSSGERDS